MKGVVYSRPLLELSQPEELNRTCLRPLLEHGLDLLAAVGNFQLEEERGRVTFGIEIDNVPCGHPFVSDVVIYDNNLYCSILGNTPAHEGSVHTWQLVAIKQGGWSLLPVVANTEELEEEEGYKNSLIITSEIIMRSL